MQATDRLREPAEKVPFIMTADRIFVGFAICRSSRGQADAREARTTIDQPRV
jgi:hypothetical protein